jgi:hypothetical protein
MSRYLDEDRMQLVASNRSMKLCTTEMPKLPAGFNFDLGYNYESCIFTTLGSSEVVGRYTDQLEAINSHFELCKKYMLIPQAS